MYKAAASDRGYEGRRVGAKEGQTVGRQIQEKNLAQRPRKNFQICSCVKDKIIAKTLV